jgi:protein required for attachment to host cells
MPPRTLLSSEQRTRLFTIPIDPAAAEASGVFDALLLIAPSHTLEALRNGLNHATANRVVAGIQKDLRKVTDHELAAHLSPWVRPSKRTVPYTATSKQ